MGFTANTFPAASFATALNLTLSPTFALISVGVTSTVCAFGVVGGAPISCARTAGKNVTTMAAVSAALFNSIRIEMPLSLRECPAEKLYLSRYFVNSQRTAEETLKGLTHGGFHLVHDGQQGCAWVRRGGDRASDYQIIRPGANRFCRSGYPR